MRWSRTTPSIALRLLPVEELLGDPLPGACIEMSFGPVHTAGSPDRALVLQPLRITPADLVRLRVEAELALGDIRAEVMKSEIAWRRALGAWHEEGRATAEGHGPSAALLVRVLEGLRKRQIPSR